MTDAAPTSIAAGKLDPRWLAVFAKLMRTEGGFVDSPSDLGGATKYGLSLRYLAQQARITPWIVADLDINHDGVIVVADIEDMTVQTAAEVYYDFFWSGHASTLPAPLDAAVFDQTVNDGLTPAVQMLQAAINTCLPASATQIAVDGVLGDGTRAALNLVIATTHSTVLLTVYRAHAAGRYRAIVRADPTQEKFLAGWLTRAAELGNV